MKKVVTGLMVSALLTVPVLALAQTAVPEAPTVDVILSLQNIINWLFGILLIVAVIFLLIAAYYFVSSQGDPEKVKTARNFVLYTLIGVAVAVAARGLVALIQVIVNTPGGFWGWFPF